MKNLITHQARRNFANNNILSSLWQGYIKKAIHVTLHILFFVNILIIRAYGNGLDLQNPNHVRVDKEGNVYVRGSKNHQTGHAIYKANKRGEAELFLITNPFTIGAIDSKGRLVVTTDERAGREIAIIDPITGHQELIFASRRPKDAKGRVGEPDIALDSRDNIYVTDRERSKIIKYSPDGQFITEWGRPGSGDGEFKGAPNYGDLHIDIDKQKGLIYILDH